MKAAVLAVVCLAGTVNGVVDIWLKHGVTEAELEKKVLAVSTPGSPEYGKYLSSEEVANFLKPRNGEGEALVKALAHLGAKAVGGDRIVLEEAMKKPVIPEQFAGVVRKVVVRVPEEKPLGAERRMRYDSAAAPVGGPDMRSVYGIPASATGNGESQLVWGPGTYGVLRSDVEKYWKHFNINNTWSNMNLTGYAGDQKGGDNFGEASLDTDIISGLAYEAVTEVSNTNNSKAPEEGPGFGYAQAAFLNDLSARSSVPGVLSLSLGSLTYQSCDILCKGVAAKGDFTYKTCLQHIQFTMRQVCMFEDDHSIQLANTEFQKLGLRGVTVLAAAGDGGMHFSFQPFNPLGGKMNDQLNEVACAHTMPTFPASSPWVTAVGGTTWSSTVYPSASRDKPAYWPGGGSGFSWDFPMPSYQKTAVDAYLKAAGGDSQFPPASQFNASMRAYPDVSAVASGVGMVINGVLVGSGGTSAAAPGFAGVITLLNQQRRRNGKSSLGFWNPALYAAGATSQNEIFRDVTVGNTKCTSASCLACTKGFPAHPGFDLATGWGSPKWAGLVKHFA